MGIENVTAHLRLLRSQKKMSQTALAKKMGLSLRQVSRWETGESKIGGEELLRALIVLDVSWDDIKGLMIDPIPEPPEPDTIAEERAAYISDGEVLKLIQTALDLRSSDPRSFVALSEYANSLANTEL